MLGRSIKGSRWWESSDGFGRQSRYIVVCIQFVDVLLFSIATTLHRSFHRMCLKDRLPSVRPWIKDVRLTKKKLIIV